MTVMDVGRYTGLVLCRRELFRVTGGDVEFLGPEFDVFPSGSLVMHECDRPDQAKAAPPTVV